MIARSGTSTSTTQPLDKRPALLAGKLGLLASSCQAVSDETLATLQALRIVNIGLPRRSTTAHKWALLREAHFTGPLGIKPSKPTPKTRSAPKTHPPPGVIFMQFS